jgi:hypothetical protein
MEILAIQILLTFALLLGHLIIVVGERLTRSKPAQLSGGDAGFEVSETSGAGDPKAFPSGPYVR